MMEKLVKDWRRSNPNICKLWSIFDYCAKFVVENKTKKTCRKGVIFEYSDDFLFVTLPSKRRIAYYKPQVKMNQRKESEYLAYEGKTAMGAGWGIHYTWGGKLVENIVQAIARDCLAETMLRLDLAGYKIVMHIHDEVVLEMPEGIGSLDEVLDIMRQSILWAKDLKLDADGYETKYYRKDA